MSESNPTQQEANRATNSSEKDSRVELINAVRTPLGFFVLVVLIVEIILGITTNFSSGNDRTYLIIGMLVLIVLLVLIVAGMAIFRPTSLYGLPMPVLEDKATEVEIVKNPRILLAYGIPSGIILGFGYEEKEREMIREAFPKSTLVIERNLTANRLRELLTKNKFDIVELTVEVGGNGNISFPDSHDSIPGTGVVELLEVANTKLLILACCNSVPLAAKLATRVNMIAATGNLPATAFHEWHSIFYRLLSMGKRLSYAYDVAKSSVQLPITIIINQDVVFAKSN